ncbi:MAG: glycine cleavage T C-terminal barrel domain-containing protein, partial [Gemmatimonadales bacterium]
WIAAAAAELAALPEATMLRRTTAVTMLDGNGLILVQRFGGTGARRLEQRLWQVRTDRIVLATGALERPIVFPDNDRPGVVLASAARTLLRRFGVAPESGMVFTTNDDGYRTALAWHAAGVRTVAVIDPRPNGGDGLAAAVRDAGIEVLAGAVVTGTVATDAGVLTGCTVRLADGAVRSFPTGCLAVAGGFDPVIGLHQQLRGATRWDDRLACEVPADLLPGLGIVGAAAGHFSLAECLADGFGAGSCPGERARSSAPVAEARREHDPAGLIEVAVPGDDGSRSFVDLHRDVTVADIDRAAGAGVRHVEHLKRYTLAGTGIEQGRSAKTNAAALAARRFDRPLASVGTSSARPPVEPVMFRTLAGRASGGRYEPRRTTPLDAAHAALGAGFEPVGQWRRPRYYPAGSGTMAEAVARETWAVRNRVGAVDVSTLGKIEVAGPDATAFLERLYATPIASIPVGRCRYGLLLGVDGAILDDGVVMRIGQNHYFLTTSTGHAAGVLDWMEDWHQSEWPDLAVWLTPVTEQWATVAVAGPEARAVMTALVPDRDWSNEAFEFLAVRRFAARGAPMQVARVSFSGELAYEVSVPAAAGAALWEAVLEAGRPFGIVPYGTEAMMALRAEKGYLIVGLETEAITIPADVGLGWLTRKPDFVGKRALSRPAARRTDRRQLVGFRPDERTAIVPVGAALVTNPDGERPLPIEGHVTACHDSEALGQTVGLAMVKGGARRHGQRLFALADGRSWPVSLGPAVHYDPAGERRDG